jgi:hypothetical protein
MPHFEAPPEGVVTDALRLVFKMKIKFPVVV